MGSQAYIILSPLIILSRRCYTKYYAVTSQYLIVCYIFYTNTYMNSYPPRQQLESLLSINPPIKDLDLCHSTVYDTEWAVRNQTSWFTIVYSGSYTWSDRSFVLGCYLSISVHYCIIPPYIWIIVTATYIKISVIIIIIIIKVTHIKSHTEKNKELLHQRCQCRLNPKLW